MGLFGKKGATEIIIYSPVAGVVKPLQQVNDEAFAGGMIGKGVAVTPSVGTVTSPLAGMLEMSFPSGHAYGIKTKEGPSILVHVGIDTNNLSEAFNVKTQQGSPVNTQSILTEVNLNLVNQRAKGSDVIVVVTNDTIAD
jgi:glucose-specific phosphotransferase system IIA component